MGLLGRTTRLKTVAERLCGLREAVTADDAVCMTSPKPKYIPLSTTDTIPYETGALVINSMLTWVVGNKSVGDAEVALADWARKHNWDAIVGVRFLVVPDVAGKISTEGQFGMYSIVSGTTSTTTKYAAYGTAIRWKT